MKVYTGRGDYGNTNLIGGRTVAKNNSRIEAYGSFDELTSLLGVIISLADEEDFEVLIEDWEAIQHHLYDAGSQLADPDKKIEQRMSEADIAWLEERIDYYDSKNPKIEKFILPGGHPIAAYLQLARTVTRRAERQLVTLMETEEVSQTVFTYINRLSDYFFVVGRYTNQLMEEEEVFYDAGGKVFH